MTRVLYQILMGVTGVLIHLIASITPMVLEIHIRGRKYMWCLPDKQKRIFYKVAIFIDPVFVRGM